MTALEEIEEAKALLKDAQEIADKIKTGVQLERNGSKYNIDMVAVYEHPEFDDYMRKVALRSYSNRRTAETTNFTKLYAGKRMIKMIDDMCISMAFDYLGYIFTPEQILDIIDQPV